jgi:hypothetical protein
MARLSETDRITLSQGKPWAELPEQRSPGIVEPTPEARARYLRWATEAAKFYKGTKPVRFTGEHWKL